MAFGRSCSTYWCDECERECVIDWHNSGDVYFVLRCTRCEWERVYVALSDVVRRYGYKAETGGGADAEFLYLDEGVTQVLDALKCDELEARQGKKELVFPSQRLKGISTGDLYNEIQRRERIKSGMPR